MKKIILFIVLAGFFMNVQGQKMNSNDVPVAVKNSFKKNYPSINDADWSKDGMNFSAGFEENKLERTVTYAGTGVLVGINEEIVVSAIPNLATAYVQKNYNGNEIDSASKITVADGTVTYSTEVDGKDLVFDSKGNFVKSMDH